MLRRPYSNWPYSETLPTLQWKCEICGTVVDTDTQVEYNEANVVVGHIYYPKSKYWNTNKKQVYCGASDALQAHNMGR